MQFQILEEQKDGSQGHRTSEIDLPSLLHLQSSGNEESVKKDQRQRRQSKLFQDFGQLVQRHRRTSNPQLNGNSIIFERTEERESSVLVDNAPLTGSGLRRAKFAATTRQTRGTICENESLVNILRRFEEHLRALGNGQAAAHELEGGSTHLVFDQI